MGAKTTAAAKLAPLVGLATASAFAKPAIHGPAEAELRHLYFSLRHEILDKSHCSRAM